MYGAGMKDNFYRSTKQFLRCSVLEWTISRKRLITSSYLYIISICLFKWCHYGRTGYFFFSLDGSGLLNWIFVTAFNFITSHLYSTVNLGLTTEYSALYEVSIIKVEISCPGSRALIELEYMEG